MAATQWCVVCTEEHDHLSDRDITATLCTTTVSPLYFSMYPITIWFLSKTTTCSLLMYHLSIERDHLCSDEETAAAVHFVCYLFVCF